ncbi:MAG: M48 family metalloprotease [Clostridia bacterium]|nr:M48 family metalloprotease [Clostridia bacterium]
MGKVLDEVVDIYRIFFDKPILFIWLIVYMMIFNHFNFADFDRMSWFIISILVYCFTITLALSPFVEYTLRAVEDIREVATSTEKERLLVLFNEVYEVAKQKSPYISKHIRLFIVDEMAINAFSLGQNTIAVSRGLMATMNDDEIKGIIAHELGHLENSDPQLQILINMCSLVYLWVIFIVKCIIMIIQKITNMVTNGPNIASLFLGLIVKILDLIINIVTFIATIILNYEYRQSEYRADEYAAYLGYKAELIQALYVLYDIQISDKMSLIKRYQEDHPRIAYRIERLETMKD